MWLEKNVIEMKKYYMCTYKMSSVKIVHVCDDDPCIETLKVS